MKTSFKYFLLLCLFFTIITNPFYVFAQVPHWAHTSESSDFTFSNSTNWSNATSGKTVYIGLDNSGLNASLTREAIILDANVRIANLYLGASYYQNPANVLNPVLNVNLPTGIVDSLKTYTITLFPSLPPM